MVPESGPETAPEIGGAPGHALPAVPPAGSWGPIATVALSFAVLIVYSILQGLPALFAIVGDPSVLAAPSGPGGMPAMSNGGFLFALGTILGAPLGIGMVLLLARARRGLPAGSYLGLRRPRWRDALLGLVLLALFNFGYDAVATRLGRPEVPDFMVEAFRTAVFLPVLWVAVVVAAPVFEELLFRGFLLEGLRRSPAGAIGATLGSSLLFGLIHLQYDLFDMTAVFALGVLFAVVRLTSGSTWLTMGLHALSNLVAMVQVAWTLRNG